MDNVLKFNYIHTDYFYPDGIETVFSGTFKVYADEDGEAWELERLFINGVEDKNPPVHGNPDRERFLNELVEQCIMQSDPESQARIKLPCDEQGYTPHNLRTSDAIAAIKGAVKPGDAGLLVVTAHPSNAREIELTEFEIIG